MQKCTQALVEEPEQKKPLGRPNRTREYNIKIYLRETKCEMDSSGSR